MHKMRADPGQCSRVQREGKRHLGSQCRQPSISGARNLTVPVQDVVAVPAGSSCSSATSEDLGTHARSQPPRRGGRDRSGRFGVSWWWMTSHTGTCMSPRRNEPSGYELGNQSLANLAVWVELLGETFVCDGAFLPFSLSCDVRHLMQVQGSLAVSCCLVVRG